jgi:LCP family protein required for cell wall assembly
MLSRKETFSSKRTWSKKQIYILAAAGVAVILIAIIIAMINKELDDMTIDTDNAIMKTLPSDDESKLSIEQQSALIEPEVKSEDFYVLLIGLDLRKDLFLLNTDSLIVAHVIPQNHTVRLLSIPRDQHVIDPSGKHAKVNGIFAEGYNHAVQAGKENPSLLSGKRVNMSGMKIREEYLSSGVVTLRQTMESFLGVEIDYSFIVNFQSVVELIDAVDGLELYVDRDMIYTTINEGTINLKKGLQVLDGKNALDFSRHRQDDRGESYWSSDFDRGRRQQEVITALIDKISNWGNITKAMNFLDIVTSNVKTDMKQSRMISLLTNFYGNISRDSIISIPYPGKWKTPYVELTDEDKATMLEQFTLVEETLIEADNSDSGSSGNKGIDVSAEGTGNNDVSNQ